MTTTCFSVEDAARTQGDRVAWLLDGEPVTYAILGDWVRHATAWLHEPPRVAARSRGGWLVLEDRIDRPTLVTLLAALTCGVPVALVHARWTAVERQDWLVRCGLPDRVHPPWPEEGDPVPSLRPAPVLDDERPMALLATSGSGGAPKGVVLSRRAFAAAAAASAQRLGWWPGDRWLLGLSIAHVGGLSVLTRCLAVRGTAVIETGRLRFDVAALCRRIVDRRLTLLSLVPTMLHRLLDERPDWRPPEHLRAVLVGGAPASPSLLRRARARGWPVLATYGATETCAQVATQRPGAAVETGCGPPLAGVEVRIEDGGIEVRGPSLASGYARAVEGEGGARMTLHDARNRDGWLRTGDLGRLDEEGHLHVIGRRDLAILSGGEVVAPEEVEAVLEAHPAVAEACVFGVADERWGERVVAVVVPAVPESGLLGDVTAHLEAQLASFKRPKRLAFTEALPRLASGKVDRRTVATLPHDWHRIEKQPGEKPIA